MIVETGAIQHEFFCSKTVDCLVGDDYVAALECVKGTKNPNWGITSFDNFFDSSLMVW